MAAKYRKIDPRIWTDEGFGELSPIEKLVALNCITGQSNRCGLFSFSCPKAAEECGISADSYGKAFSKVCDILHWKYDLKLRVLYIPTWWKYNPPENEKHLIGCLKDLSDLPKTLLIPEFTNNTLYISDSYLGAFKKAMLRAMGIAIAYQEQEQKQEQKEPASAGCSEAADATAEPPITMFACLAGKAKKPTQWPLTKQFVAELSEAYPGVDILQECRKAWVWLRAAPGRMKTHDGMKEFIRKWVDRTCNSSRGAINGKPANQFINNPAHAVAVKDL